MRASRLNASASLLLLLSFYAVAQTPQQSPLVVLRAARLLDIKAGKEVSNPIVIIVNPQVTTVRRG